MLTELKSAVLHVEMKCDIEFRGEAEIEENAGNRLQPESPAFGGNLLHSSSSNRARYLTSMCLHFAAQK